MDCLNFYVLHTDGSSVSPSILFGKPLDWNNIECNAQHFPEVSDHLEHDQYSTVPFDFSETLCSKKLKNWYCSESKHES